jgi:4'-phosphopantetheinyl transferase
LDSQLHRHVLGSNDVHVWIADLEHSAVQLAAFEATLSPDEQARANRFHFQRDRNRFVAARGQLRTILGAYLGLQPSQLQFSYGQYGKPVLEKAESRKRKAESRKQKTEILDALHFNLAHSGGVAPIAVTKACEIGVDVECVRQLDDAETIASQFFSINEAAQLSALPDDHRPAAFFNLWTRKEAILKALGMGLGDLLKHIEVTFLPGEPARIVRVPEGLAHVGRWTLEELNLAPNFKAALAAPTTGLHISCFHWPH